MRVAAGRGRWALVSLVFALVTLAVPVGVGRAAATDSSDRRLTRIALIKDTRLQTKSLGISPGGIILGQNMMYRHNVTVFDQNGAIVKVIPDTVDLTAFGIPGKTGLYQGSPVEVAFSPNGAYAYVSNYRMYGKGYRRPGHDKCPPGKWDESFVFRIDLATLEIDQVISVGAVPKFMAVTPDGTRLLVSNWCSFDVSVIDLATTQTITRVKVGRFPRGIVITADSSTAYVAVMGANKIVKVDLATYQFVKIAGGGITPRHLLLSPDEQFLYVSNNLEHVIRKVNLATGAVKRLRTGLQPRSMVLSEDGASLYVVNYVSGTLSKVRTADFVEVQRVKTGGVHPVGITYDPVTHRVWVANYKGSIAIFQDS